MEELEIMEMVIMDNFPVFKKVKKARQILIDCMVKMRKEKILKLSSI